MSEGRLETVGLSLHLRPDVQSDERQFMIWRFGGLVDNVLILHLHLIKMLPN